MGLEGQNEQRGIQKRNQGFFVQKAAEAWCYKGQECLPRTVISRKGSHILLSTAKRDGPALSTTEL